MVRPSAARVLTARTVLLALSLLPFSFKAAELDRPDPRAAGMNEQFLARIPERMREYVKSGTTAGIVTILARHGHLASFEAVGFQNIENKIPMGKDTMFRIASLTKPITCAGIMILVDEGKIALIDPVEKYLSEYKGLKLNPCGTIPGYNCSEQVPARPINIQDLMTHTSGLPASESSNGPAPQSLAEQVSKGAKLHLLFEPGTNWSYSNIGINILGRIIEVVSHQPFDEFLNDRIFGPLRMKDTYFFVPQEKRARVATLYTVGPDGPKPMAADWGEPHSAHIPSPAGGLVSTAADLLRFNEMMRRKGTLDGHRILSPSAVELMTVSHTGDIKAGFSPGVGHGFGYEVVRSAEGMYRYNSIGTYLKGGAYRTFEWVDPSKDMVGVFLMQRNSGDGDTTAEINSFVEMSAASIDQ